MYFSEIISFFFFEKVDTSAFFLHKETQEFSQFYRHKRLLAVKPQTGTSNIFKINGKLQPYDPICLLSQ